MGVPTRGTPWGAIEVSDAHVHFFSPAFFGALKKETGLEDVAPRLGFEDAGSPEALADRWVAELDKHQIARANIIASTIGDAASVAAAAARHPERLTATYKANPMVSPVFDSRATGLFLFPAMHRYSLHDPMVRTLLESASRGGARVVFVHCGALSIGFRRKLGLPCRFDLRFSNPADLHLLAMEFPKLTFVVPHFGAGYFREALMLADLCPNVCLDTSSSNHWMEWQPGGMTLAGVLKQALQVAGPHRLLFGSDSSWFPRGWVAKVFDEQVRALAEIGADADTVRAIFGGNLSHLLR